MCGIFAAFIATSVDLESHFSKIGHRGPDMSKMTQLVIDSEMSVTLGCHRLAINDTSILGMQPFELGSAHLLCNGIIFNCAKLQEKYNITGLKSKSDCEILLHLYSLFGGGSIGFKRLVKEIDGEYSIILFDSDLATFYVARDPFGIRPLFIGRDTSKNCDSESIFFSSEIKAIHDVSNTIIIDPFESGLCSSFSIGNYKTGITENYLMEFNVQVYSQSTIILNEMHVHNTIRRLLNESINSRLLSDVPIGAFLSGGVDSSLICALLAKKVPNLQCFSIGLGPDSPDIIAAKQVAKWIGIAPENHHCIYFTVQEGINVIRNVIKSLESWDTTTIRASIPQYLLSQWISKNTDIKVMFSGELADEIFGGYRYMSLAPSESDFELESKRLITEVYMYDALRVDRCVSAFGLECRIPFADSFLMYYLTNLPARLRQKEYSTCGKVIEKALLRDSFSNTGLLPDTILYRSKDAFSDAVSSEKLCWYKELQKYIESQVSDSEFNSQSESMSFCQPMTKEAYFYKKIFNEFYPKCNSIIPGYWLPKWIDTNGEPSATVIHI
jgi:asparagine synthase (glutamine-hydrolysing)